MARPRLPDSILLGMILELDVPTLKSLRLTSRSFNQLIQSYPHSISTQLLGQVYAVELTENFLPLEKEDVSIQTLFLADRRIKLARWMALYSLGPDDLRVRRQAEYGSDTTHPSDLAPLNSLISFESLLRYITVGLGIMWSLSDIASRIIHEEFRLPVTSTRAQSLSTVTRGYERIWRLEQKVLQAQLSHLYKLDKTGAIALWIASGYCSRPLYRHRGFSSGEKKEKKGLAADDRTERVNWVRWLLFREGPNFIAKAWLSTSGNESCTKLMRDEYTDRSEVQRLVEQQAVITFHRALKERFWHSDGYSRHFSGSPPGSPLLRSYEPRWRDKSPPNCVRKTSMVRCRCENCGGES